jgi:RNA polymerase sigma-70 factor (ECF subfamily)
MGDSPATQPSLLLRIRQADDADAWARFVEIYAPLIYAHARKYGFQDADAADLTQEVLRTVSRAASRLEYDPRRGSFRGWLFTVVRNLQRNFLLSRQRHTRGSGDTNMQALLEAQPDREEGLASEWEQDYEQRLFAWAAEQVRAVTREATWQAFWLTAVEGKSAKQVARMLGMTPGAVYVARSRVLARLKERIQRIHED